MEFGYRPCPRKKTESSIPAEDPGRRSESYATGNPLRLYRLLRAYVDSDRRVHSVTSLFYGSACEVYVRV